MPKRRTAGIRGREHYRCSDLAAVWVYHRKFGTTVSYHEPPGGPALYSEGFGTLRWFRLGFDERGIFLGNFVRRARETLKNASTAAYPDDAGFIENYPAIWDFMTCDRYDDGKARQRSSLTVFCDGAAFKASLNDKEAKCSAFVSGTTFSDVLSVLEAALQDDTADWRSWNGQKKK